MVAYWSVYRQVTDTAFARLTMPKVAIETSAGDWTRYGEQVRAFLDLPPLAEVTMPTDLLQRYAGTYE